MTKEEKKKVQHLVKTFLAKLPEMPKVRKYWEKYPEVDRKDFIINTMKKSILKRRPDLLDYAIELVEKAQV